MSTILDPDWDNDEIILEDDFEEDEIEWLLLEVEPMVKDRSNEVLHS